MFVIAVPSLIRFVLSPSASEHASESLFASVMKTPEKPASSAARDHSIRRGGGLSGRIVHASAILAMMKTSFRPNPGETFIQRLRASSRMRAVGGRWTFSAVESRDKSVAKRWGRLSGSHLNLEDECDETICGGIDRGEHADDRGEYGIRKRSKYGRDRGGVYRRGRHLRSVEQRRRLARQ